LNFKDVILLSKADLIMKAYKKLDGTLEYLIKKKDPYGQTSEEIHNNLKIADDKLEQHLILNKLVEEKYASVNVPKNKETGEEYPNNPYFVISYEGMVFNENGGYSIEHSIRKRELTNRKVISWLNPAWKILAFLGTSIGVILGLIKLYLSIKG